MSNATGGLIAQVAAVAVVLWASAAQADTRYYYIQTQYGWQLKATEDATGYDVAEDRLPLQAPPTSMMSPLDLTALLKVDDMNVPGRKVRVTFYFQSLGYTDETHHWAVNDFSDRQAIGKLVRDFITQSRHLDSIPVIAAYEEEAIACLLLTVHEQSVVIDLDVPPDMPDSLVYQADALIYDAFIGPDESPSPRAHGIPWFESDQQVKELQQTVLQSDVKRVERLRHLLWGHLKLLALFVESHHYDYFYPLALSDDAPTLMAMSTTPTDSRFSARELADYTRQATFNKITPAYAFPALYRWASMSTEDFAGTFGQAHWRRVASDPHVQFTQVSDENPGTARRAESAVQRLELVRQALSELNQPLLDDPDSQVIDPAWLMRQQQRLGRRYLDTLTRIHQSSDGNSNLAVAADHAWVVELPIRAAKDGVADPSSSADDHPPSSGQFGLWLASLDQARFKVDEHLQQVDIHRINERSMVVTTEIQEAPLFVPGLASDHSPNRMAIVDVESKTMLEARRLTPHEAKAYLPPDVADDPDAADP